MNNNNNNNNNFICNRPGKLLLTPITEQMKRSRWQIKALSVYDQ